MPAPSSVYAFKFLGPVLQYSESGGTACQHPAEVICTYEAIPHPNASSPQWLFILARNGVPLFLVVLLHAAMHSSKFDDVAASSNQILLLDLLMQELPCLCGVQA